MTWETYDDLGDLRWLGKLTMAYDGLGDLRRLGRATMAYDDLRWLTMGSQNLKNLRSKIEVILEVILRVKFGVKK